MVTFGGPASVAHCIEQLLSFRFCPCKSPHGQVHPKNALTRSASITVCLYFCSRELCASPYAVSLLGVYKQQSQQSDESIFSSSSLDSNTTLKNDILYLCRGPDVTYGTRGIYVSPGHNIFPKSGTIEQPTPIHPWPQMKFGTDPNYESAEVLTGTTVSPNGTLNQLSSAGSTNADLMSMSRTPTTTTTRTDNHKPPQATPVAELPSGLEPLARPGHKRQKSSVTSLRRFLPKIFGFSLPLSADPQIRALAEPTSTRDIEKQADSVETAPTSPQDHGHTVPSRTEQPVQPSASIPTAAVKAAPVQPAPVQPAPIQTVPPHSRAPQTPPTKTLTRSDTMSSADAPEVARPAPLNVRRSNTSQTAPIPRTPYNAPPCDPHSTPPNPMTQHPVNRSLSYGGPPAGPSLAKRQSTRRSRRPQTQLYEFENPHIPRHTRSQYLPQAYYNRHLPFEPPRRISSLQRRNDVEVIYSSTRRPRSTTYGGLGSFSNLDCIRESGASVDEAPEDVFTDRGTYRGTTRTSMNGF